MRARRTCWLGWKAWELSPHRDPSPSGGLHRRGSTCPARRPAGRAHQEPLFCATRKSGCGWWSVWPTARWILKSLAEKLGARGLSFASPERLLTHWGVRPGAVTPFGAINDTAGAGSGGDRARGILAFDRVNCHPLDNAMTTNLATADLLKLRWSRCEAFARRIELPDRPVIPNQAIGLISPSGPEPLHRRAKTAI